MPGVLQLAARLRRDRAATRNERAIPRDERRREREQRDQSSGGIAVARGAEVSLACPS